jgi:hypothetical protein
VKRKHKTIVLNKIVDEPATELRVMVAELSNLKAGKEGEQPSRWGRRFAASGKRAPAPKLRLR